MSALATFHAGLYRKVSLAMAKRDVRYCLEGVRVEPNPEGGVLLIATNGHVMLVGFDPRGSCSEPFIFKVRGPVPVTNPGYMGLDRTVKEPEQIRVTKAPDMGADAAIVEILNYGVPADLRIAQIIADKYPDWRRIVTPSEPLSAIPDWMQTQYVELMAKAMSRNGRRWGGMCFRSTGPQRAVFVQPSSDDEGRDILGVVMPMRDGERTTGDAMPAWIKAAMPKTDKVPA